MIFLCKNLIWFMIYSFIGWVYESLLRSFTHKRWYNSGFLNGPYIPIYGCGAILDLFFLGSYTDPLQIFLLAGSINCILEYATSYIMEKLFHARWWDYSDKPFNLNGRIYLLGFVAFGAFATLVILYFHPWLEAHTTARMTVRTLYSLSSLIVAVIFTDTVITVSGMRDFRKKYSAFVSALEEEKIQLKEKVTNLPYSDQIHRLRESFNFQERRLLDAFPNLKFEDARYTALEIKNMVIEHSRKLF